MLVIVSLLVMVRMFVPVRSVRVWFMLVGMRGPVAMMGMLMLMFERMGMAVMVVVHVIMLRLTMPVDMLVVMIVFVSVRVLVWMFSLAHVVPHGDGIELLLCLESNHRKRSGQAGTRQGETAAE